MKKEFIYAPFIPDLKENKMLTSTKDEEVTKEESILVEVEKAKVIE